MWPYKARWAELFYSCLLMLTVKIGCGSTSENVTTYYCSKTTDTTLIREQEGQIRTVFPGSSSYRYNQECSWAIAAKPGYQIQVKVLESHLEWASLGTNCDDNDYLEIYDGDTRRSPKIVTWCGNQNPKSVISKGSNLYIRFRSNSRDPVEYRGIHLSFTAFLRNQCPPDWQIDPVSGSNCYMVKALQTTWEKGQDNCGYSQANLAYFSTEKEADFVAGYAQKAVAKISTDGSLQYIWLGLADSLTNNVYRWLDGTEATFFRWHTRPHKAVKYADCAVMRSIDGQWQEENCRSTDVFYLLCQRSRDGGSIVLDPHKIEKLTKGRSNAHVWVIIAICVILAIIAIVLAVLVIYRRCFQKKKPEEQLVGRQPARAAHARDNAAFNDINDSPPQARFSRSQLPPPDGTTGYQSRPLDGTVVLRPSFQDYNRYQQGNMAGSGALGPPPGYDNEMALSYTNNRPIEIVPSTGTYNVDRPPLQTATRNYQSTRQGSKEVPPQYHDIYPNTPV